jgi:hypothetical protein
MTMLALTVQIEAGNAAGGGEHRLYLHRQPRPALEWARCRHRHLQEAHGGPFVGHARYVLRSSVTVLGKFGRHP